jgi:hypothetical protein
MNSILVSFGGIVDLEILCGQVAYPGVGLL